MNAHKFMKMQALKLDTSVTAIAADLGYSAGYFWSVVKNGKKGHQLVLRIADWLNDHDCDGAEFLRLSYSEHDDIPVRCLSKAHRKVMAETFARLWEEEQKERKNRGRRA